jgi:hypothetical protein
MDTGGVPEDWKSANVTPIFKKGAKSEPGNYRPVSLTSICCKLLESILRDVLMDHLERNKLINQSQHGFMPKKSCGTNLLEFLETVTREVDEGRPVDVIFLDFAKAFDKVPKERLLQAESTWSPWEHTEMDPELADRQKTKGCAQRKMLGLDRRAIWSPSGERVGANFVPDLHQ